MDVYREFLWSVLRTAAELRPGDMRRASSFEGYDMVQLTRLLSEMLAARLVIGAAVTGPSGPDFILVGLTRTGGQLLADLGSDESWAAVLGIAEDEWLLLTVESLAALAARRAAANARPINVDSDAELRYWLRRFGCTREELRHAMDAVGVSVEQIERYMALAKRK